MKYIIMLVIMAALLPGISGSIDLGIFYISLFRLTLIVLTAFYFLKYVKNKRLDYFLKSGNIASVSFMILWFLYSLVTVFWVRDLAAWMHGEYFIGIGVLAVILFDMAELKFHDFCDILVGVQLAMLIHNILGWYEIFTHHYLFAAPERLAIMNNTKKYFPISMMTNQNDFMLVLILGVSISLFFVLTCKKTYAKVVNILFLFSNMGLCLMTDSRLGILAMLLLLFIIAIFLIPSKIWRYGIIIFCLIFAVSLFAFPQTYLDIIGKITRMKIFGEYVNPLENSDAVRINLIKNGFVFLKETWGFGVGTGNVETWMGEEAVFYVRGFTNMHNWWMEILTNFGVIIFTLYLFFYGQLLYSFYKKYKNAERKEKVFCVIIMSFMIAFIPASISSSSNWGKEWLWVWWAFLIAYQGSEKEAYAVGKNKIQNRKIEG